MIVEIVVGLTALISLVCFFMVFGMLWSLSKENDRMSDRLMDKASLDSFRVYSTEVYSVRKRLDVLADHLNVKIVDQEAKPVVEPKEKEK